MGKRGPAKTPTRLLAARGSPEAKRRKGEPEPDAGVPAPPAWLDQRAKQRWRTITPRLNSMGLLGMIDEDALITYCAMWSRWRAMEIEIQTNGAWYPVVNREGQTVWRKNPAVEIAADLLTKLNRLQQQFGMTPSGRASLALDLGSKPSDDKARFFKNAEAG